MKHKDTKHTKPSRPSCLSGALFIFAMLLIAAPPALSANRPISKKWDIDAALSKRMSIQWFAGESVEFELQPVDGRSPFDLTGSTVYWEVADPDAITNVYIHATGVVTNDAALYNLTPAQGNLPAGEYYGWAYAVTPSDERVVLCYQTVEVSWSPAAGGFIVAEPEQWHYTAAEVAALEAAFAGVPGQITSISNTLSTAIDLKQDAATAATDAELSAGLALKQDAATAATDAELVATSNTLASAIAAIDPDPGDELAATTNVNVTASSAITLVISNGLIYAVIPVSDPLDPQGEDSSVSYALYVPLMSVPTTNYPAGFSAWTLASNTNTPSGSVLQIAEWTKINSPGDTMALTAENMNPSNLAFVVYGQTNAVFADVQVVDGRQAAVTLPESLPVDDLYLLWGYNSSGFGEPVAINAAKADWVGFDQVVSGDKFYIYGKSLRLGSGSAYCYIEELDTWVESTSANPYRAEFEMPGYVPNGTYTIYAHNGHGGPFGFSEPLSLTVYSDYTWTGTTIDVTTYGANGSDESDDTAAIISALAASATGDTIYFPDGTYLVNTNLSVVASKRLKWTGQSQAGTVLSTEIQMFGKASSGAGSEWHDLTISNRVGGRVAYLYNVDYTKWKNCTLTQERDTDSTGDSIFSFDHTDYTYFTNCTFVLSNQIDWKNASTHTRMDNCRWLGIWDINQMTALNGVPQYLDFNANYVGNLDFDARVGYGNAKGRWLVANSADNIYVGDCVVSNMAPRIPIPYLTNSVTSWSALGAEESGYSLGYFKEATITFDDIPDAQDGWGNDSIDYAGVIIALPYSGGTFDVWVATNNATDNTCVVRVKATQYDEYALITAGSAFWEDKIDQNSGEMILLEGFQANQVGNVLSGTASNLTISVAEATESGIGGREIYITGGKGLGQHRSITDLGADGVIAVDKDWNVIPDSTSTYEIASGCSSLIVYNNYFSARETGLQADHKATTALQGTACGGVVFSGNTLEDMRHVIRLYGYASENSVVSEWSAPGCNYFWTVEDNVVRGTAIGFFGQANDNGDQIAPGDAFIIGNVFRGNSVSNATYMAPFRMANYYDAGTKIVGVNVYDSNEILSLSSATNLYGVTYYPQAYQFEGDSSPQVIVGSSSSGTYSHTALTNSSVRIYGNTWTGFGTTYGADATNAWLEIPQRIVSSTTGTSVTVYNSGGAELSWTAADSGIVDLATNAGTIAAESSAEIDFTFAGSPTNGQSSVVTVIGPNNTSWFAVMYGTNLVSISDPGDPLPGGADTNAYVELNGTDSYAVVTGLTMNASLTIVMDANVLTSDGTVRCLFGTTAGNDYGMSSAYGNIYSRENSGSHVVGTAELGVYRTYTFDPYTTQTASAGTNSYSFAGAAFAGTTPLYIGVNPYTTLNGFAALRVKKIYCYVSGVLTSEFHAEDVTGTTWPDRHGNFDMTLNNCTTGTED